MDLSSRRSFLADPEAANRDVTNAAVPGGGNRLLEQPGRLPAPRHMLLQEAAQQLARRLVQLREETKLTKTRIINPR